IILKDEIEEDVPLLEEESDSSKVLKRLQHEEEVKILKKSDKYTYVEYMNKESGELLQGFILTDYLNEIDATHKKPSSTESDSMDKVKKWKTPKVEDRVATKLVGMMVIAKLKRGMEEGKEVKPKEIE